MNEETANQAIKAGFDNADPSRVLPGEDMSTPYIDDVHHWVSVYRELLDFKARILTANREKIAEMPELDAELGEIDVPFLESEITRLRERLAAWQRRQAELEAAETH